MNHIYEQRLNAAADATADLATRLTEAAAAQGWDNGDQIAEAIAWTSLQLDPEADDYETWEATVLARLEDSDRKGER